MRQHATLYLFAIFALRSLKASSLCRHIDNSTLNRISRNSNAQFVGHGNICNSFESMYQYYVYKFRLKHELSLRKHVNRHKDVQMACTLCGKITPNKTALSRHMGYVHSEATHKCGLCDKAFKREIGLKVFYSKFSYLCMLISC